MTKHGTKILLATVISLSILFLYPSTALEYVAPPETPKPVDRDLPLKEWLYELEGYESTHKVNAKILDVNGKYSYGCLQFQMETFIWAGMKYRLFASRSDAEAQIMDCSMQHAVALAMLKGERQAWRHWYTSVELRGLGRPPAVSPQVTDLSTEKI